MLGSKKQDISDAHGFITQSGTKDGQNRILIMPYKSVIFTKGSNTREIGVTHKEQIMIASI